MFKIKVIRKDYNTQIDKKIYKTTNKFIKYGSDYFRRKHNTDCNAYYAEAYCKCFKMNSETEKWEEINPEDYFGNNIIKEDNKQFVLYSQDLGINYNGYPLENIDLDEIRNILVEKETERYHKNKHYILEIVLKEVI